jgi:hypothetical protein
MAKNEIEHLPVDHRDPPKPYPSPPFKAPEHPAFDDIEHQAVDPLNPPKPKDVAEGEHTDV